MNFSAQETNVSLERLQRNLRLLREESGQVVNVGLHFLREDLHDTKQNNSICLLNLYKLRLGLITRVATMTNQASRNPRLQSFLNTLSHEVQSLNHMEGLLINTNYRIESLREELSSYIDEMRFRQSSQPSNAPPASTAEGEATSTQSQTQEEAGATAQNEESRRATSQTEEPRRDQSPAPRTGVRRQLEMDGNDDNQPPTTRRRLENDYEYQPNGGPGKFFLYFHEAISTIFTLFDFIAYSSPSSDDSGIAYRGASEFSVSSRSAFQPTRSSSQRNSVSPRSEPGPSSRIDAAIAGPSTSGTAETSNTVGDFNSRRTSRIIRSAQRISQSNFDIFWEAFQRYLNSANMNEQPANENNENTGEQWENGYWLLEENSNSDSNHDEPGEASNSTVGPRRRASRWIQLDSVNWIFF